MSTAIKLAVLTAVIASFIAQSESTATCDDGWTAYGPSCYFFEDETKLHWIEGTQYCSVHEGAYITTIQSEGELLFLQDMCRRLFKHDKSNFFFLGATDSEVEGIWRWYSDNSLVNAGYHNWYKGQPEPGKQNCAVLWGPSDYTWHDHYCNENGHVICEKPGLKWSDRQE
ncbi:hypothetical protein DPMN_097941 [Dreissena polymorpha]|uniref:C-type lectin domain-containing protein n=1 Tax=Dreissena polymorpha TaxID=45954 RepID=A0A9D4R567_DREPO|nr:hypothetical protein DPMN_097941 [Dreissena polymorpha]